MQLSDTKIRNAKAKDKPYKLTDGGGLFVLVKPSGSKLWQQKYRYMGKERLFSAGAYPIIGASDARNIRDTVKKLLAQGIDPTQQRRITKQQKLEASENTFEALARRWLDFKKIGDSHKSRSLRRLELHAFPRIGFRPIGDIKTIELATCLEAIEREGINETAHIVKQIMQQVFRYAVRRGIIDHNPAGDLRDIISHVAVKNRACIPPAELPTLLRAMANYHGEPMTKAAMHLLLLTFVRTAELIEAKWNEIDLDRKEWQIPAERMKMRNSHIVPLSRQALAIFKELQESTGRHGYVFFSPANKDKHISNNSVLSALKRMGYAGRMTGHGFRALASTILNEQCKYHPDVIERQLAHADRNPIRAVYDRSQHLLKRINMMQEWADYIDTVRAAAPNVIEIKSQIMVGQTK